MAARKTSDAPRKSLSRKSPSPAERKSPKSPDGPYAFHEGLVIVIAGFCTMLVLALISYSPADLPSWVPFSSQAGRNAEVNNFIGPVGAVVAGYSYFFFGAAAYLVPAVLAWWGVQILTGARPFHGRNLFSFALLIVSAACLVEYQPWFFADWSTRLNLPKSAGGFIGFGLGQKVVEQLLGSVGSVIVMALLYSVALIVITGIHPFQFLVLLRDGFVTLGERWREFSPRLSEIRLPSLRLAPATPAPVRARTRVPRTEPVPREPKPAKAAAESAPTQAELFQNLDEPPAPAPQIHDSTQRARKKLTPEEAAGSLFDRS
ncbi:MAG TPA: DNA translocase FtsK 4TM domain-containing protein, partial [Bacteroidia bacterium]|nr:DNA translocase FtsK 4TM domain-containing protein [Bacteroidia bacterium]